MSGALVMHRSQGGGLPMDLPGGFGWTPPGKILRYRPGVYGYTKNAYDFLPGGVVKDYYVDNANGNNGAAGGSTTPLLSVSTAQTKADVGVDTLRVIVRPLPSRMIWSTRGTVGSSPTKNVILMAEDGGELIFAKSFATTPPSWTSIGSNTFTTTAGVGTSNTSPPMDWSPGARAASPYNYGMMLNKAVSAAAVVGVPNSYFHDATTGLCTVCAFDLRNLSGDAYMTAPAASGNNGVLNIASGATAALTYWADNCIWVGGGSAFGGTNQLTSVTGVRGTIVHNRCGYFGSSALASNGFGMNGAYDAFQFDCYGGYNYNDTFNMHDNPSGSGRCVRVGCKVLVRTGFSNLGIDNCFTGHEDGRYIDVMPVGFGDDGRSYAFVDQSWALAFGGGPIGPSIRTDQYCNSVQAGGTTQIDLYEVIVGNSLGAYTMATDGGAFIRCHNMDLTGVTTLNNVSSVPL